MKSSFIHIITVVLLFTALSKTASGQDSSEKSYEYEFRGESLVEVLDRIVIETDIDLVYDPQLINGINVYQRIKQQSITALLSQLLSEYKLDYITLSSGTMVIVKSPREEPAYGIIAGKIVDNETGEPLPGASIMLADASGGTSSNRAGFFSLNKVMSGTHQVIVSYLGYESSYKTIDVKPNESVQERIELKLKQYDVSPLVVEAHRPMLPTGNSPVINNSDELSPTGIINSPIRNLNLAPGVQYGLPMQDLHLQGSHQGEHRITLDGVPIYNPYSFGHLFSSFSPFAIGDVKLHKAGFGVQEGSQMAGLVELSNDLSFTGKNSLLLQSDLLSSNLKGDMSFPLRNNRKLKTMAALRTSYWDFYQNPALDQMLTDWNVIDPLLASRQLGDDWDPMQYLPHYQNSDVNFLDIHAAAKYQPNEFNSLTASFYIAENSVKTLLLNINPEETTSRRFIYSVDNHEWSNFAWQLQWNKMISPRLDLHLQTYYTQNVFNHSNALGFSTVTPLTSEEFFRTLSSSIDSMPDTGFALPEQIDGNRIQHFTTKGDLSYSFSPALSTDAGLKVERVFSKVELADNTYLGTNTDQLSTILSGYLQNNHTLSGNWKLNYGSRLTYLDTSNRLYAEPRFSVQFDQPESILGYWSARIAGGMYRQFVNEFRVTNTGATSIVPDFTIWSHSDESSIPKAYHISGSIIIEPSAQTTVNLEGFYKWQPVSNFTSYQNLLSGDNLDRAEIRAFAGTTEMTILGAGTRISHHFKEIKTRVIAGYDFSFNRIDQSEQFGRSLTTPWNEPHRAQLRLLYRPLPNLTVLAKWQGIWGRSWSYRQSYYNYLRTESTQESVRLLFGNPELDKLDTFLQTDLSFIYRPEITFAEMEFRIELINLLNRRNSIEKFLMPIPGGNDTTEFEVRERLLPGFYPSLSIQMNL